MQFHSVRPLAAAFAIAALAGAAQAQLPAEGTVDWQLCFGGPVLVITPAPQVALGTYSVTGAVRSTGPLADTLTLECLGSFESRARQQRSQGYCVYQAAGGDRIYGTDSRNEQGYTWTFLGGTGKYEGISGSGSIEVTVGGPPVRPGTLQGCRHLKGSWKIAR